MKMADLPSSVVHKILDDTDDDDPTVLDQPPPSARADMIVDVLRNRRLTPPQIAEMLGLDVPQILPALGRAVRDGDVVCCGKVDRDPPPARGPRKIKLFTAAR